MNEEIERVVLGLVTNAKLDSYDKDLIRRIIIGQQKEIECYKKALKECIEQDGLMKFLDKNDWATQEDYFVQLAKEALYK